MHAARPECHRQRETPGDRTPTMGDEVVVVCVSMDSVRDCYVFYGVYSTGPGHDHDRLHKVRFASISRYGRVDTRR